jgi:thioredoxin reductase (NADPH)
VTLSPAPPLTPAAQDLSGAMSRAFFTASVPLTLGGAEKEKIMATAAKMLIIGSGPAGYTAAIYAARALLEPIVIQGMSGGQLTITSEVENYPGFASLVQGPWLMEQMQEQAVRFGARIKTDMVAKVDLSNRPFLVTCESGDEYLAESLIIATGAQARWLNHPAEQKYRGGGVSACATCDGFFYRGKKVIVIGGGNTAVEDALYLSGLASAVTLVHRRDRLRAEKILQERLFKHPKIGVRWNAVLHDVVGADNRVAGVQIRDTVSGEIDECAADGIFVAIGHAPSSALFRGQLDLDSAGYVITSGRSAATSIAGVFAAGDVTDSVYRQAVTAAGQGCMAALEAERFLSL